MHSCAQRSHRLYFLSSFFFCFASAVEKETNQTNPVKLRTPVKAYYKIIECCFQAAAFVLLCTFTCLTYFHNGTDRKLFFCFFVPASSNIARLLFQTAHRAGGFCDARKCLTQHFGGLDRDNRVWSSIVLFRLCACPPKKKGKHCQVN